MNDVLRRRSGAVQRSLESARPGRYVSRRHLFQARYLAPSAIALQLVTVASWIIVLIAATGHD